MHTTHPAPALLSRGLALCALVASASAAQERPNVIVVITDDQGYGDLGAHGNPMIQTPHMDRLWSESTRLTNFHVDPTCSPSRSALMTGRYSTRTGVWHTIMGRSLMDPDEVTLAEVFQGAGYRTGMVGKWHLGDNWPLRPQDQGFESVNWHHGGGVGQGPDYWDNDYFGDTYEVDGSWRPFEGYCTDVWFDSALDFIRREDDRPFLLYLSTNAPHGPYFVDESYSQPYRDSGVPETMARFYGMVSNIDHNLGRLRQELKSSGLAENTLLLFMTDNGTAAGHAKRAKEEGSWRGFPAGMRGNKGSEYEGGHRVPCFLHWPKGGIPEGQDLGALTAHIDLLPTLAELCSLPFEPARPLDGQSLAGALTGSEEVPERTLFVHSQRVQYPKPWRKSAVMKGRWRLIGESQLYDLHADPDQSEDVAADHPQVVRELREAYQGWWTSLEPSFHEPVRIGLGGPESPSQLMSHDWHTEDQGVPWHQNHVRNGYVSNGPWKVEVAQEGTYAVTLLRWPAQLERAMGCNHAGLRIGDQEVSMTLGPEATQARFELQLPAGPADLLSTLRREDGTEHGAYFVQVERIGG